MKIYRLQKPIKGSDRWKLYTGKVYCCTVDTGVIFVRRNGKSVWCGNSTSAQKGTCSIVLNQEDMPFTAQGITPDIIINPHCIISRMTINQLMGTVLGKESALSGTYGDATPFSENSTGVSNKICEALLKHGFNKTGTEIMYNGFTGEAIDASIFIGPTYYQRLKHLVKDKMHARRTGQVTQLTRQPLEGRSRDGGLRYGEMERDHSVAIGSAAFLMERLFTCSDKFYMFVCKDCGQISKTSKTCGICEGEVLVKIKFPYASKLFIQQIQTMGIKMCLIPEA